MYALHRVPRGCIRFARIRGNATLEAAASADAVKPPPPPPPPNEQKGQTASLSPAPRPAAEKPSKKEEKPAEDPNAKKKRRRVQWPTSRPSITLERPRQYMRPIGVGVLPVYDEALQYIKKDSEKIKKQLVAVKAEIETLQASPEPNVEEIEGLKEKVHILEIQSQINLPSVRWKARNGLADMSRPIYRHLLEKRWREEGALDLVMERVHQMNVVPDLLPELHPSFDLRVNFPERLPDKIRLQNRTKAKYEKTEPGIYLLPEQTRRPPVLYTTVFHMEPRLYTLLMVDLDVPDPSNTGFQPYLHWMHPNISLHVFSENPIPFSGAHTPYIPPHPQRGTPYHRYVLLLVPQASPTERIKIPAISMEERLGFNYRRFAEKHGLDGSKGGGVFMWREIWDETVSKIYSDTLKMEEPVYGRVQKFDPHVAFKATKRYL